MGTDYEATFFDNKRPWSEIKDSILRKYLNPYLKKVNTLDRPILLVDAYAGQGVFGPEKKPGSPLIIAQLAEKFVRGRYRAIFNNRRRKDHEVLQQHLFGSVREGDVLVSKGPLIATHADARELLHIIRDQLGDHTLFLYVDPMGLRNPSFALLSELLSRVARGHSTEILMRVDLSSFHRHGARHARQNPKNPEQTRRRVELVDDALGGKWWREIEWDMTLEKEEREARIMRGLEDRLRASGQIRYVVSCPVKEREGRPVKYYLTFCSRHPDALVLMNEAMLSVYDDYMHRQSRERLPLFSSMPAEELFDWERQRPQRIQLLRKIIPTYADRHTQGITRYNLQVELLEDHFLKFLQKEYRKIVKVLVEQGFLFTPGGPTKLNDKSILYSKRNAPI